MSLSWEYEENKNQLTKKQQRSKPPKNDVLKTNCPYCGHEQFSTRDKNIRCSTCKKWFDRGQKLNLVVQEIPTVIIKQSEIEIGRFCKCGCGNKIPIDARKDKQFFKPSCKASYQGKITGFRDSRYVLRSRIKIKSMELIIYPGERKQFKIKITKEFPELWNYCNKLYQERAMNNIKEIIDENS